MKNTATENNKFRSLVSLVLVLTLALSLALPIFASASYPKESDFVGDQAKVLTEATVNRIKELNKDLYKANGTTIAVCTVNSTGEILIGDYARQLFKEWKMGEGVLMLIAVGDKNYYFVQSVGLDSSISNEMLKDIRDKHFANDFDSGNIDNGVRKTVEALSSILKEKVVKTGAAEDGKAEESGDGTKAGSAFVTTLKVLLYIVLGLAAIFVIFFVFAMFNDDAAQIMRKYIFRKGNTAPPREDYYDERLYGERKRPESRPVRRDSNSPSRQNGTRPVNRPDQNPARRPAGRPANSQANRSANRQPSRQPNPRIDNYDETQSFTMPTQNHRR